MTRQTYTIELITPCFCAGADPAKAEIRAPSIRGQLRWWFRVLGNCAAEEAAVFGAAADDEGRGSSSLRVAITDFKTGPAWTPPTIDQKSPQNYTWHFAAASGKPANAGPKVTGPRWQAQGALPPGTTFKLSITQLRPLNPLLREKLQLSIDAFLCFGTIGLRATRGLGAFQCAEARPWRELLPLLTDAGFITALRDQPDSFSSWESALKDWSAWLRYKFRKERKAAQFSALGGIRPRQASAVRFRPMKVGERQLTWLALEAPHGRMLGSHASTVLTPTLLTGPAPTPLPRSRY